MDPEGDLFSQVASLAAKALKESSDARATGRDMKSIVRSKKKYRQEQAGLFHQELSHELFPVLPRNTQTLALPPGSTEETPGMLTGRPTCLPAERSQLNFLAHA